MQSVLMLESPPIDIHELVSSLERHGVVIVHTVMRGQAEALNREIIKAMELAGRKRPVVNYLEFETDRAGDRCFMPTFLFEPRYYLCSDTRGLIQRAVDAWLADGSEPIYQYLESAGPDR